MNTSQKTSIWTTILAVLAALAAVPLTNFLPADEAKVISIVVGALLTLVAAINQQVVTKANWGTAVIGVLTTLVGILTRVDVITLFGHYSASVGLVATIVGAILVGVSSPIHQPVNP